jgi:hypothetical protein
MMALMLASHAPRPLFVVVEPSGAAALEPAARVCWACDRDAGVAAGSEIAAALERIMALAETHALHLADPLFDAPRLGRLLAAAGVQGPSEWRDWLVALAPLGQARRLAAMLEAAEARSDPENPASRLLETWRAARARGTRDRPQPRR